MLGIAIYHGLDLREHSGLLPTLLSAFAEITGGQNLAYVGATLAESGLLSRELQLTPKNLANVGNELRQGRYDTIEFSEYRRSKREGSPEEATLDLSISADPQASEGSPCPFVVYALVPDLEIESTDALVRGAGEMAHALGSPYAMIYGGRTFTDVFMEITATPIFPWNHALSEEETQRRDRLLQAQLDRKAVGDRVRGAYWGNYLGPRLVAALGGVQHVHSAAPVLHVRPYGDGGLYLQLTDDPADWSRPGYADRVAELERFFEPSRTCR
jgi:hypothetical protein